MLPALFRSLALTATCTLAAAAIAPAPGSTARLLPISDRAWAGSSINVVANIRQSLFTHGTVQYAAYYDADGFMVLARRVLGSDAWETRRTDLQGNVADAHNSISLAVDGDGYLHVAWNHHANPLNYARSTAPGSLELGPKSAMTGRHEDRVTYPQFFLLPDGDLLFLYRDGASGRGSLVLNRYAAAQHAWSQVQPDLIDGEGKHSPYWGMTVDKKGALHLAWIWRDSPDVTSNHDLAYAHSTDGGVTWTRTDGTLLPLPLTDRNCEYAARIPTGSNLMNSPSVAADDNGRPYIATYWSSAPGAAAQFQIVRHDGKAWTTHPVASPLPVFTLAGAGTKHPPVSRGALLIEPIAPEPAAHLIYRDDSRGGRIVVATTSNLVAGVWQLVDLTTETVGAWEPSFDPVAWDRLQQIHLLVQNVRQLDGDDRTPPPAPPTAISSLIWSPNSLRLANRPDTPAESVPAAELEKSLNAPAILALLQRAADWQLQQPPSTDPRHRHPRGWEMAPFYIGALALDRIAPDHRYRDAMLKQAEANAWEPHSLMYHADDHCVIQAYLELHHFYREPRMLAPAQKRFDEILATPSTALFDWGTPKCLELWSWCDALFMAPMSWLLMWEETHDSRYLDFMNREWWRTTDRLFNPQTGFYFRDESYLDLREPNGRTIHWARGNGWVFAGLARVLDHFPKDHPDYPRYLQLYHTMAAAVLAAQQSDGLWRSGLLDPVAHRARETSGSSFMTFGLAWGVNRGVLDRASVEPAVRRAWNALALCVTLEGKLEHVQPVGAAPHGFDPHNTEPFAVGAFLLAGSEVHRLAAPSH